MRKLNHDEISIEDIIEYCGHERKYGNLIVLKLYIELLTYIYLLDEKKCTFEKLLNYLIKHAETEFDEELLYKFTKKWYEKGISFTDFVSNIEKSIEEIKMQIK